MKFVDSLHIYSKISKNIGLSYFLYIDTGGILRISTRIERIEALPTLYSSVQTKCLVRIMNQIAACLLLSCLFLLPCEARWAGSFILTPDGLIGAEHPRAPKLNAPNVIQRANGDVEVRFNATSAEPNKTWHVITSTRRLKAKERHLEAALGTWKIKQTGLKEIDIERMMTAQRAFTKTIKDPEQRKKQEAHNEIVEKHFRSLGDSLIEEVKPILEREEDALKNFSVVIPKAERDRTYLYYGFCPGAMVLDGGERVTIDLPAFVDALASRE